MREPAEECGLPYEDLIWEALDALAQSSSVRRAQSEAPEQRGRPGRSEQHSKRYWHHPGQEACLGGPVQATRLPGDPLWHLIRDGEGFRAAMPRRLPSPLRVSGMQGDPFMGVVRGSTAVLPCGTARCPRPRRCSGRAGQPGPGCESSN